MACPLNLIVSSKPDKDFTDCTKKLTIAHDFVDVINGKWKMDVILCLLEYKKRRFKELQKDINGVSSRILSSVLKDLEINHIITRKVIDTAPITVEYELTEYGLSMKQVIIDFVRLGLNHRKELMGK